MLPGAPNRGKRQSSVFGRAALPPVQVRHSGGRKATLSSGVAATTSPLSTYIAPSTRNLVATTRQQDPHAEVGSGAALDLVEQAVSVVSASVAGFDPLAYGDWPDPKGFTLLKGREESTQGAILHTRPNASRQIFISPVKDLRQQITNYLHKLNLTASKSEPLCARDIFTHVALSKTAELDWNNIITSSKPVAELVNIEKLSIFAMSLMQEIRLQRLQPSASDLDARLLLGAIAKIRQFIAGNPYIKALLDSGAHIIDAKGQTKETLSYLFVDLRVMDEFIEYYSGDMPTEEYINPPRASSYYASQMQNHHLKDLIAQRSIGLFGGVKWLLKEWDKPPASARVSPPAGRSGSRPEPSNIGPRNIRRAVLTPDVPVIPTVALKSVFVACRELEASINAINLIVPKPVLGGDSGSRSDLKTFLSDLQAKADEVIKKLYEFRQSLPDRSISGPGGIQWEPLKPWA